MDHAFQFDIILLWKEKKMLIDLLLSLLHILDKNLQIRTLPVEVLPEGSLFADE